MVLSKNDPPPARAFIPWRVSAAVPQDSASLGLNSMMNALGGQLQGFATLLGGGRQPIDMYLAIGRSSDITVALRRASTKCSTTSFVCRMPMISSSEPR